MTPGGWALGFVVAIIASMLAETWWSRRNERRLRALGAHEPSDDVYAWMQVAYPASFGLMIAEGAFVAGMGLPIVGAAVFVAAKALKYWAIRSLGSRWCFRVLVPPATAPVVGGPYRWIRHPNYVAVALELAAVAPVLRGVANGPRLRGGVCLADVAPDRCRGAGAGVRCRDACAASAPRRRPSSPSRHGGCAVCDAVTMAALAVLASITTFGPIRIMTGDGRITLSSVPRALVVIIVVAGLRHWRVARPHVGTRVWAMVRKAMTRAEWRAAWTSFAAVRVPVLFVGLFALAMLGYPTASKTPPIRAAENELLNLPVRWDAGWYLGVATDGYQYDPASRGQQSIAFFPGYPMLMRAGGALLGSRATDGVRSGDITYADAVRQRLERTVLAGWLVALACGVWGMARLYRFALDCGADAVRAGAVVMLAAAYPFAYFYGALYTESLFLLAVVATFSSFTRRDYLAAACWGVIVGLSRPNGCFVSIPLAIIATQQAFFPASLRRGDGTPMTDRWRSWVPAMATAAVPGLAMLAFTAWLYSFTGLSFAWLQAHKAWGREYHSLITLLGEQVRALSAGGFVEYVMHQPIDLVNGLAALFVVAMAIPVARVVGLAYGVFLLINILPPLMAGGFLSLGRVSSTLFPMFVCLALTLRPPATAWLLAAWGVGQGVLAALFFSWRPIY